MAGRTKLKLAAGFNINMHAPPSIEQLVVSHRKIDGAAELPAADSDRLRVITCLRAVDIGLSLPESSPSQGDTGHELLFGTDAYRRLLEITTGLHSQIPGETNVFGQFRHAWRSFTADGQNALTAGLAPVMQRLFADTKAIRRHWLQGVGGHSYGSLVRRLLEPRPAERVLFVGAGKLMQSIIPLFGRYQVGAWNRSSFTPSEHIDLMFSRDQGRIAAEWAQYVVLTTPPDTDHDGQWRGWFNGVGPRTVLHLGHRDNAWLDSAENGYLTAHNLEDIFNLQSALHDYRASRLARARAACARLAAATLQHSSSGRYAA